MPKNKKDRRNTKTALKPLSKKHKAIEGKLGGGLKTKLDTRLQSLDKPTTKQVESLLHFDRQSQGKTTEAQRLSVRAALSGYVARGGDIQAANRLKTAIATMTPAQLAKPQFTNLLQALQGDADLPLAELSKGLLDPTSPTSRSDFEQLKLLLTSLPADISKANTIELVDGNVTIGRDATGQLEIKNHGLLFATVTIPPSNKGLDKQAIDDLKNEFRTLAKESYSTQGLALDFMQFFRETNEKQRLAGAKELTMAEAFQQFTPDGSAASDKYKRGDCMCHAQKLKAIIENKKNPTNNQNLKVHVIGMNNQSLTKMADPAGSKEKVDITGVDQVTEGVTHTDLMVPYTDDKGNRKVLLLAPGAGSGDNYIREFDLDADGGILIGNRNDISPSGDQAFAMVRRVGSGPDPGMDADAVQKAQFQFRHNLQLLNSQPGLKEADKALMGIDLVGGTIYLNGNASKEYLKTQYKGTDLHILPAGKDPANLGSLSFNFKDAIAHPDDPVTIQVWNAANSTYESKQVTKLKSLTLFLRVMQQQFKQPNEWFDNAMALMTNHEKYTADILLPNLKLAAEMQALGKAAVKAVPYPNSPQAAYEKLMSEAGAAVRQADKATAKARYTEAIVLSDVVAADAVLEQLKALKPTALVKAQKIRRLAQQAINDGDSVKASNLLQGLTRTGLREIGMPIMVASPATLRALADFPTAGNEKMIKLILELDRRGRDSTNSLSPEVAGLIANVAKQSPQLAKRLARLAIDELNGQEKAGITDFMAKRAQYDSFMADLKSPLDASKLPTAATLGFDPKFHVPLAPAKYQEARTLALRLQAEGTLGKLSFDDASNTIHMGYTYQTFVDICGGLDPAYRADNTTSASTDGFNLKNLILGAITVTEPKDKKGLQLEKQFGNPAIHTERQQERFEAVRAMYDQYNDFDFAAYDRTYSPTVQTTLANDLQGKLAADQMTELLNQYDGFTISDDHGNAEMKQVLLDNLDHLAAQNVKVIGIEHLKDAEFSDMLREYYAQPDGTPMSEDLRAALRNFGKGFDGTALYGSGNTPPFFTRIVAKAKQLGIQIVPLDTENMNAPEDKVHSYEVRHGAMNMVGEKLLRAKLATLNPGEKYVLLAGAAHNNTHPGLTRGMPGFAQTLGIPAVQVIVDKDRADQPIPTGVGKVQVHLELDLEDKKARRPVTADAPQ